MKKIMIPLILLVLGITSNAQSTKKEPPPPPPKPKSEVVKPKPPIHQIIIDEIANPTEPNEPPVIKVSGQVADDFYNRSPSISDISRQGSIISLKKKDGSTEKYDMSKKEEDKSFTEKYGVSPIPPPPPPPKQKTKA